MFRPVGCWIRKEKAGPWRISWPGMEGAMNSPMGTWRRDVLSMMRTVTVDEEVGMLRFGAGLGVARNSWEGIVKICCKSHFLSASYGFFLLSIGCA